MILMVGTMMMTESSVLPLVFGLRLVNVRIWVAMYNVVGLSGCHS